MQMISSYFLMFNLVSERLLGREIQNKQALGFVLHISWVYFSVYFIHNPECLGLQYTEQYTV